MSVHNHPYKALVLAETTTPARGPGNAHNARLGRTTVSLMPPCSTTAHNTTFAMTLRNLWRQAAQREDNGQTGSN